MKIDAAEVKRLRDAMGAGLMDCKKALIEANGDRAEAEKILKKKGMAKAQKKSDREAAEGKVIFEIAADGKKAVILEGNCETDFVANSDPFQAFLQEFAQAALAHDFDNATDFSQVKINGESVENARHAAVLKLGENIQLRRATTMNADGVIYGYTHGNKIAVLVALEKEDESLGKDIAMHIAAMNPAAVNEQDIPQEVLSEERAIYEAQLQDGNKPQEIKDKIIAGKLKKFASGLCLYGQAFVKDPKETIEDILQRKGNKVHKFIRFELGQNSEK